LKFIVEIEDNLVADLLGINHLTPEEIEESLSSKYDEIDDVIQTACDQALEVYFNEVNE